MQSQQLKPRLYPFIKGLQEVLLEVPDQQKKVSIQHTIQHYQYLNCISIQFSLQCFFIYRFVHWYLFVSSLHFTFVLLIFLFFIFLHFIYLLFIFLHSFSALFIHALYFFVSTSLSFTLCILFSPNIFKNHKKKYRILHPSLTELHNTKILASRVVSCKFLASNVERTNSRDRSFLN